MYHTAATPLPKASLHTESRLHALIDTTEREAAMEPDLVFVLGLPLDPTRPQQRFKLAQEGPEKVPRWPQDVFMGFNFGRILRPLLPDGLKTASTCPKTTPRGPKRTLK